MKKINMYKHISAPFLSKNVKKLTNLRYSDFSIKYSHIHTYVQGSEFFI